MRSKAFTLFGFALLVSACQSDSGGQTGDFSGQDGEGGPSHGGGCRDIETPIDASDDSALGFSADEVLTFAEQSFTAPLAWQEQATVTYGPESGMSELTLSATATGEVWYVTSELEDSGQEGGPAIAVNCPPPRLRLGVQVELTSDGGALAESFATTIDAASPRLAKLDHGLSIAELGGSFTIESTTPANAEIESLTVSATLSPAGMTGSFSGLMQVTYPDDGEGGGAVSAQGLVFATWPASAACPPDQTGVSGIPVGIDHPALGLSGAAALEAYNEATPVALRWENADQSELTLTATGDGDGCVRPNPFVYTATDPEAVVTYPVTLHALSADGRLDGTYAATLSTSPEGDDHRVVVEVNLPLELDQAADAGLGEVTLPDGLHRLFFQLRSEVEAGDAHGAFFLNGLTDPPCVTDPPEPDPNGMGAPGCEGTQVTELDGATWGRGSVD